MRTMIGATLLVAVFGCGGSKDWSKEPLKSARCTFKGHAIEISVPDALEAKAFEGQCNWMKDVSSESYIQVMVMEGGSRDVDDAKVMVGRGTIVKAENTAGGGYVLAYTQDEGRLLDTEVVKVFGKIRLRCTAKAANVDKPDAALTWLVSICTTLKLT